MSPEEKNIVKGCKRGDEQAQFQFYRLFSKLVYSICMRYAKDVPEAEDIMQEAFINLYRDLYQFKASGALGGWVRRVTVNTALRHVRKKRMVFSDVEISTLTNSIVTDDEIMGTLRAKEIMRMIQLLPDGYRMVFNLYVIEGYSHKEIAAQLGIAINTSKSQLSRAKKQLKGLLEQSVSH